jgi:hypothetical protein
MYPAIIIIIVCMQIGKEVFHTRQERSNGLDLTTFSFTAGGISSDEGSRPTTTSWGGKMSTMSPFSDD